mmetsp:Transcript_77789/g.154291  ORF Transcript_77789/g.154291 Transcript_77789/m.154291 type:complete len:259 (-) Transcript_77789:356-1132(-)
MLGQCVLLLLLLLPLLLNWPHSGVVAILGSQLRFHQPKNCCDSRDAGRWHTLYGSDEFPWLWTAKTRVHAQTECRRSGSNSLLQCGRVKCCRDQHLDFPGWVLHVVHGREDGAHCIVPLLRTPADFQNPLVSVRTEHHGRLLFGSAELEVGTALFLYSSNAGTTLPDHEPGHATSHNKACCGARSRHGRHSRSWCWICNSPRNVSEVILLKASSIGKLLKHNVTQHRGCQNLILHTTNDHGIVWHANDALPAHIDVTA